MAALLIHDEGGVRTITLNRPERKNALNAEMQDEIVAAFESVEAAGVRVVVLTGAGGAFCAGLDLDVLRGMRDATEEQNAAAAERVAKMFGAVAECAVPTIAMVEGPAIAGGTGLATICDFTLAAPEAKFAYTEVRIGFIPALVSVYLMLQVGDKIARGLLLSGRVFGADEALRLGLVSEMVAATELRERTYALAAELMRNSPESLRATKKLLLAQHSEWMDRALALAIEANKASRQAADFKEGVASFVEKRKPVWSLDAK